MLSQALSNVGLCNMGIGLDRSRFTGSMSVDFFLPPEDQSEKTPSVSLLRFVNLEPGFLALSKGMESKVAVR